MMDSVVLLDHPFRSETMLFFRLSMFQQLLDAPQDQVCKCFVHESDISNGPEVCRGSCVLCFWKRLEQSFWPTRWNLLCVQNLIHDAQESCHNIVLSGAKCDNSATNPHSSEALFVFSRLMVLSSVMKKGRGGVKWSNHGTEEFIDKQFGRNDNKNVTESRSSTLWVKTSCLQIGALSGREGKNKKNNNEIARRRIPDRRFIATMRAFARVVVIIGFCPLVASKRKQKRCGGQLTEPSEINFHVVHVRFSF